MERYKRLAKKLMFPHWIVVTLLVIISSALLIYVFVGNNIVDMVKYSLYFISAYTLMVVCARIPEIFRWIVSLKETNRYVRMYMSDPKLRVRISLFGSVSLNILYAFMQLVSGVYFKASWFYALAAYYFLLIAIRLFLLRNTSRVSVPGKNLIQEFKRYRFCGVLLLLMNQAFAIIVFFIVRQSHGFEHSYIHTILMAAYTLIAMVVAVVNVVRYRRYESPLMSAAKAISLASAVVSVLSLETAILGTFSHEKDLATRKVVTASTGAVICVFVLLMAVCMIVHASKEIKVLREEEKFKRQ